MTRVLQVSRSVIDGGFDYHADIARAFTERGSTVLTVFQRGFMDDARVAAFPGEVVCLDARHRRRYKQPAMFTLALWGPGAGADLAICHHFTPARAVAPLVTTRRVRSACMVVHDFDYFHPADREGRKRRRFLVRALRHSWTVIGVSSSICANVRRHVPELPAFRCKAIPNAIDVKGLRQRATDRQVARDALALDPKAFVIGTVGRLVPFKAQSELISAFASVASEMTGAQLVVVGRGPLENDLRRQVEELDLVDRVFIRGFVDDAARHMRALDLFVLPSHDEPFGLVLLEAMACGVPVIASDSGGPLEILPLPEQLFPTGDPAAQGQRILALFRAGAAERRRIAEAGHRRAIEAFSLPRFHSDYASLLMQQRPQPD